MAHMLSMNDTINVGKNKHVLVSDIVHKKGEIFNLIKDGFQFDDEVLKEAHIKKTIRDVKTKLVIVNHEKEKKKYKKETENLKNIIKSFHTIDNQANEVVNNESGNYNEEAENMSFIEEED